MLHSIVGVILGLFIGWNAVVLFKSDATELDKIFAVVIFALWFVYLFSK